MLKMVVVDLENDHTVKRFGSERELLEYLKLEYPLAMEASTLKAAKAALEASDLFKVTTEPYEPSYTENVLPADYLTVHQEHVPDPWPRMGEQDDVI